MGIYSTKFNESAVEDTIQTPDDIGNDLEQIEKNIAGPDGIEGHKEEIEDAATGVVEEPLEEAAMAMYESEYNYNQLMQAIGMQELADMQNGREMVMEAADIKGFFARIAKIVKGLFEKITGAVKRVLDELTTGYKHDQKWLKDNADAVRAGAATDWKANGYNFADTILVAKDDFEKSLAVLDKGYKDDMAAAKAGTYNGHIDLAEEKSKSITRTTGLDAKDIDEMKKALHQKLYGSEKPVELKGASYGDWAIKVLQAQSEVSEIKKAHNKIKADYTKTLGELRKMEKEISSEYASVSNAMTIANSYTSMLVFERNVANAVCAMTLQAAKAKRSQARSLAHKLAAAGRKGQKGEKKTAPVGESAFDRLSFM